METITINRFDEQRPFDVVRAEDFGGDLYEFYEPLEKLIRKVSGVDITGSRPVFLIGGRGTGKTMVLKFLSIEMQLKDYIKKVYKKEKLISELNTHDILTFLKEKKFIGLYLRFKSIEYDSFKEDQKILFKPYFSIKVAEQIFYFLEILKKSNVIEIEQEFKISEQFIKYIVEPKKKIEYDFNNILDFIKNDILPLFEIILEKSSFYSFEKIKNDYKIPIILYEKIIFSLSDYIFNEINVLKGKNLFILLDELEFLNDYQKRCIGELIRGSDETSVIFKIGSRYMPKILPVGDSDEVLQEPHDIRIINITKSLNAAHGSENSDYSKLIKNVLNKRLNNSQFFKNKGIVKIEQLFPNYSIEEEATKLVKGRKKHWQRFKSYVKKENNVNKVIDLLSNLNPIIEKLNMLLYYRENKPEEINEMFNEFLNKKNKKYATLYSKNSLNLLFQLYGDYRAEKKYAGINVIIHLSSGIIRNAIEICNQALNVAYNYGYQPDKENPLDVNYQHIGCKFHAELQYDDITRIPLNKGLIVQEFINQIGTIFKALHMDRFLIEPEPTHFETNYSEIKKDAKEYFDAAIQYSYIQEKPSMYPKRYEIARKKDFLLNRVFAPYFNISHRIRGRTYISAVQIQNLILGDDKERNKIRREIIRQNTKKREIDFDLQKKITEYKEFNNIEFN